MIIDRIDTGSETLVRLSGTFTFDDQVEVRALMRNLAEDQSGAVHYELSDLKAIDSSGIGLLLMTHDRLTGAGKSFKLSGATGAVETLLRHAKVAEVITIE